MTSPHLTAVPAGKDAANADDPRQETVGGRSVPRELLYAERMSRRLEFTYPNASELLRKP